MADAAARQLQYEYKAVSIEVEISEIEKPKKNLNTYIFFIRTLILYYKLMSDSLKEGVEMKPLEKLCL